MTSLRQRMIEDMQIRNLAANTQQSYVQQVSLFARHFNKSPELLGPEQIRAYQVYLTNEKQLATRFHSHRHCGAPLPLQGHPQEELVFDDLIPAPKTPQKLPVILSPEEVLQFLGLRQEQETSRHLDHLLCRRPAHLRGRRTHTSRDRQQAHGHPGRARQRKKR